jgi:excisionase family DNA binding protein
MVDRPLAPSFLTVGEVSSTLRVSEKTVRRMIERRELRGFRVGGQVRVQRDSLVAYLQAREIF